MKEQTRKNKEKQTHPENEINKQFSFTDDRPELHQQHYHNQAKIYQTEHPELSYREALKTFYKKHKN